MLPGEEELMAIGELEAEPDSVIALSGVTFVFFWYVLINSSEAGSEETPGKSKPISVTLLVIFKSPLGAEADAGLPEIS